MRARPTWVGRLAGEAIRRGWEAASQVASIRVGDHRARRFIEFGEASAICFPFAAVIGEDRISMGSCTIVGPYSTLCAGLPGQPPKPAWAGPSLVIGDRCMVGRNATILAHREIVIEDDVWMGNGVFISDQNHDWVDADLPIGRQSQEPRPVRIGANTVIGNGARILPGAVIGERAIIAAGAVVTGAVPDHAIVGGIPAQVIGSTQPSEVVVPLQPVIPA